MARMRNVHLGLTIDDKLIEPSSLATTFLVGIGTAEDHRGIFAWKERTLRAGILLSESADGAKFLPELEKEEGGNAS